MVLTALAALGGLLPKAGDRLRAQGGPVSGSAELSYTLDRLNTLGSLLFIGAHPDDERETMVAYFARGRKLRTAYLSATRGEGGQNLIGPEQSEYLGVIRTQELLAARRLDGGEQYFTRAIDFGYSKSPEEALARWGRQGVLGDLVRVIRRFRPDVIVSRFSPDASSGHGHHTAIGQLVPEAYAAAAAPSRYPEQIRQGLRPWQAKRLYWSPPLFTRRHEQAEARRTDRLRINTGEFDPLLGSSYAELGGRARSRHRSQGMGSGQRKGDAPSYFGYIAGDRAGKDLFEGVDLTWSRVSGGTEAGRLLAQAREQYAAKRPETMLPLLIDAHEAMKSLDDPWAAVKRREVVRAIELAAGLWADAAVPRWDLTPGSAPDLTLSVLNRSHYGLRWMRTEIHGVAGRSVPASEQALDYNQVASTTLKIAIPAEARYSQPRWLRRGESADFYDVTDLSVIGFAESAPPLEATFYLSGPNGAEFALTRPVIYRWVDRAAGERTRLAQVVPAAAVSFSRTSMIFPDARPRQVSVDLVSHADEVSGHLSLDLPAGWRAVPEAAPFEFSGSGQRRTIRFMVHPPAKTSGGQIIARAAIGAGAAGRTVTQGVREIEYPHIPIQVVYPEAAMRVERTDVRLLSKRVGYIMGSGDRVPESIEQLGAEVTLLSDEDLAGGDLSRFDTVITGIRALNVRPAVYASRERLMSYVERGGTLVVQYNTLSRSAREGRVLAPYPMTPSSDRVSREEAGVRLIDPEHPLLTGPNRITEADFDNWVQERGLYFMSDWDERYQPLLACNDPDEPARRGGLLYTRHGKGVYIFTGYSWFRQLPAGVPGAYRLFANLLSAK